MKEKLTRNGSIKLISLFCAFFVWLAVVNVANPIKVSTEEVKVEFINGQVLEDANLTYEIVGKSTATISFKVRTMNIRFQHLISGRMPICQRCMM